MRNAPAAFDPYAMAASMSNNSDWHERIVADMFRSDGMTSGQVMGELMMDDAPEWLVSMIQSFMPEL